MSNRKNVIGEAINRIDGLLKVTGTANYATDFQVSNPAYAFIIKSTIAAGRILDIETQDAEKSAGVIAVITHKNAPKLNTSRGVRGGGILQNTKVDFFGQNIGVHSVYSFQRAAACSRFALIARHRRIVEIRAARSLI